MNGYNFTERVRKILAIAREEAARLSHEYCGTEHILLGLIREGEGVAATVLQNLSVELDVLRIKVEEIVRAGQSLRTTGPDLPYTSRAKKVLELAMSEARALHHSYVGSEHILIGLLREEKGIAAQVLNASGVTLALARHETLRILGSEAPDEQIEKTEHVVSRRFAWLRPDHTSKPTPRAVIVEIQHADGWTLRREFGSIAKAIHFLSEQQ